MQTDEERQAVHQEPGALTSPPSPGVKVMATTSEDPEPVLIAAASKAQSDKSLEGQAPEADKEHAEACKEMVVEIKTSAELPVRIPLESLDPNAYCLRAVRGLNLVCGTVG